MLIVCHELVVTKKTADFKTSRRSPPSKILALKLCLGCAELRKFVFRVYPVFVLQIESRTEAKANWSQRNDGFSLEG